MKRVSAAISLSDSDNDVTEGASSNPTSQIEDSKFEVKVRIRILLMFSFVDFFLF